MSSQFTLKTNRPPSKLFTNGTRTSHLTSEQRHHTLHSASITRRQLTRDGEKSFPRRKELGRIGKCVANEDKTRPDTSSPQYEAA